MKKSVLTSALAGAAMATALVASPAHAGPINIGGVMIDPDSPLDFGGTTATVQQSINPTTGELSGYAVITSLNGTGAATFCPGCELTAHYWGYTPVGGNAIPTPTDPAGSQIFYSGGFIQVFVDMSPDAPAFNALGLNLANTTDGQLWLDLTGHAKAGVTLTGTNNFSVGFLQGKGLWDVIGGLAAANMDTNTMDDGADFSFSNTFTSFPTDSVLFATGSGTFNGNTVTAVPEPDSLALMGVGLLGLLGMARRRGKLEA